MRRTTITWPEELADAVGREARLRGVSVSEVVREALKERFRDAMEKPPRFSFIGIINSDPAPQAADVDEFLAAHWAQAIENDR